MRPTKDLQQIPTFVPKMHQARVSEKLLMAYWYGLPKHQKNRPDSSLAVGGGTRGSICSWTGRRIYWDRWTLRMHRPRGQAGRVFLSKRILSFSAAVPSCMQSLSAAVQGREHCSFFDWVIEMVDLDRSATFHIWHHAIYVTEIYS